MAEPELHVDVRGEGPVVALAHGFGGSSRNFRALVRALAAEHRVITWDLRGHARSGAPDDPAAYSLDALADDVGRVLEGAGGDRAVVGGLSLGAAAALRFARRHPRQVRGLLLASYPAGRGTAQRGGFTRVALEFARAIEEQGLEAAGERFVWGPETGLDPGSAAFVRQGFLEHPPHALVHLLRSVLARLPEPDALADELTEFEIPTLLVAGGADPGSEAACRVLAEALPRARLEVVPEAGHVVNLAAPDAFHAVVRDWLEALPSP